MDQALQQQKRTLLPFLDLAQKAEKSQPKAAYYCRLYAIEQAAALGEKNLHPDIAAIVLATIEKLEKVKPKLDLNKAADGVFCLQWAQSVFALADKLDRGSGAQCDDLYRAGRTFVSAEQGFRVAAALFSPLPAAAAELQKYALWRGIELLKAHKAGKKPAPPPPLPFEVSGPSNSSSGSSSGDPAHARLESFSSIPGLPLDELLASSPTPHPPPPPSPPLPPLQLPPWFPRQQPSRQFIPGQAVLYCPEGHIHCQIVDAEVREVRHSSPPSGELEYTIYLLGKQRREERGVHGELLAPRIAVGAEMVYFPEDGGAPERCWVEAGFKHKWPASFLVKTARRGLVEVEDEQLVPLPPVLVAVQQPEESGRGFAVGEAAPTLPPIVGKAAEENVAAETTPLEVEDAEAGGSAVFAAGLGVASAIGGEEKRCPAAIPPSEELLPHEETPPAADSLPPPPSDNDSPAGLPAIATAAAAADDVTFSTKLPTREDFSSENSHREVESTEVTAATPPEAARLAQQLLASLVGLNAQAEISPAAEVMDEAQKALKSASSALAFEDAPTAVKLMLEALEKLMVRPAESGS